jgi:autotransporter translocation and assembly factor TamB
VLAITALCLTGVVSLALGTAALVLQGERLARVVSGVLPEFEGKLELQAIRWSPRLFLDLVTDRPTAVVVEGLRITDPEGTEVLRAPRLEVKVRARSAIGGKIYLHDLKLGPGSFWRFARMQKAEGIGFLAWFKVKPQDGSPPPKAEEEGGGEFLFQIVNADLDGLTAQFDFPGAWGLELRDIKAPASLLLQGSFVGWDAWDLDARGGGYLKIIEEVLPFDRVEVRRVATTREWPDHIFLDVKAARTGRTTLVGKGFFTGIYGYGHAPGEEPPAGIDLHAELDDAADALTAVAARHAIEGLRLHGERVRIAADLKDAFERLKITGRLEGLDAAFGSYELRALEVEFGLDLGDPMSIDVKSLRFLAPGGGGLALSAGLKGAQAQARLSLERFTTDSYLPRDLRALAAGTLDGGLRLQADLERKSVDVSGIDLRLARRRAAGLPRTVRVLGQASASSEQASTRGLTLRVPGASATARGRFTFARQVIALGLRATASDLPRLLRPFGLPPLARAARLEVDVRGTAAAPEARGTAVVERIGLGDLPEIGALHTRFSLQKGVARVDALEGAAFGGQLDGQGQIKLFEGTLARLLRAPVVSFRLDGKQIELGTLVAGGLLRGKLDFSARVEGPANKLRASLVLPQGAELELLGERWTLGGIEVETDLRTVEVKLARLDRSAGGRIEVTGRMSFAGQMSWQVVISDVPLAGLPGLEDPALGLEGRLSARLEAGGTLSQPSLQGEILLAGVVARGVALGDAKLTLSPAEDGGVDVLGDLFGRFDLRARAGYDDAGPRVTAQVAFSQLVLEELLPEMVELGDSRGRLSGSVEVRVLPGQPLFLQATLTEIALSAAREVKDASGQSVVRRLNLRNGSDLRLTVNGSNVRLARTRLVMDGGEFRIQGSLEDEAISGEVSGLLNLELLQPFVGDQAERLSGDVTLALKVSGTRARPAGEGSITIASPVLIKLLGFGPEIAVPSGRIVVDSRSLRLENLAVDVEGARMTLEGRASFDERQNVSGLEIVAGGEINARLLESLAGSAISDASGRAHLQARVTGTLEAPQVNARIDLKAMEFRLRDLGREIEVESGTVELTTQELLLRNIRARVDGQGRLLVGADPKAPGRVAIRRLSPTLEIGDVWLPLRGERLTFRVSDAVELDDIGLDLVLAGDTKRGFSIAGEVLVASGRYVQDFTMRNLVISPSINESAVRPFYDGKPLLENLALDLRLRTVGDSFLVQNNLAPEIHVVFALRVRGTLAQPLIAGDVRPTDGRFRIFGVRGDFNLVPNVNYITFVDTKSMADGQTPELNLEAEAIVTDTTARDHQVRMRISGPIGQASIDLSTSGGLDRNQTLLLLLSGRTTEEEPVLGTRTPTLGPNVSMIGQISRDSVADLLEPYIDDTLQLLTGGKLNLRPTVGADGFELRLDARAGRQVHFQLSLLRGFQGQRRYRAESNLWLMDYVSLRSFAEQLTLTPFQGIPEEVRSLNLELTLDFPIRFLVR